MTSIEHIAVVVPARDESELIERCIRSIREAEERLAERCADEVATSVVVVADGCTDDTVSLARNLGVIVIDIPDVGVGAARAIGIAHVLRSSPVAPERLWIANTDADSAVTVAWLIDQCELAQSGVDARIGAVRPNFADLTAAQLRVWRRLHRGRRAAGHVHGANLGVRASSYLAAGGFRPLIEHEDVELVDRLRASGARVVAAPRPDVVTSGRSVGRTPGGYAGYLRGLALAGDH
jgi:glycosyltransferase involved in cell wall biosynthesis